MIRLAEETSPSNQPTLELSLVDDLDHGRLRHGAAQVPAQEGTGQNGVGAVDEMVATIARSLIEAIAGARTGVDAELVLCHVIGTVDQGVDGQAQDRAEALGVLLDAVRQHAERLGTGDALAALHMLAALGPAQARAAAAQAAQRIAARGVAPRPWAERIGQVSFLRAWRYGDVFGEQDSLGVLFDERGRSHALMVLIDHGLGGGVKDAWVVQRRDALGIRDRTAAQLVGNPTAIFEDVDVETAAVLLRAALAEQPCPEQDDQIRDVATHLPLVVSRAVRLAELAGLPAEPDRAQADRPAGLDVLRDDVLQVKVSLRWAKPPIWRRLEVPASITLERLHQVLQAAFGWDDDHLYEFETGDVTSPRGGRTLTVATPRRTRLGDVLAGPGARALYRYDFGDNWEHLIEVEALHPPVPGQTYPACTAGRRAAPPENCGGIPGHAALLDALADLDVPDHAELLEWVPAGYDPARFDRDALNRALAHLG